MSTILHTVGPLNIRANDDDGTFTVYGDLRPAPGDASNPMNVNVAEYLSIADDGNAAYSTTTSLFVASASTEAGAVSIARSAAAAASRWAEKVDTDLNASVTVTYKGQTATFLLDGNGLQQYLGSTHRHMNNGQRHDLARQVENILMAFTEEEAAADAALSIEGYRPYTVD